MRPAEKTIGPVAEAQGNKMSKVLNFFFGLAVTILMFCLDLSGTAYAQIPDKVKTEMLLTSAIQQAERSQFESAQASLAAYRKRARRISPAVELLDAQLTFLTGDDIGAFGKLSSYFEKASESDPDYAQAVEMATLLKDLELPYLLARIPEKELREKPYARMRKIAAKGYNTTEIQALADQGNLRAMYMYGVIHDEKGTTRDDALRADVYLDMACRDGFKMACGRLRSMIKRDIVAKYRALEELMETSQERRRVSSRGNQKRSFAGAIEQQLLSQPLSVCRTGKIQLKHLARWQYYANGSTETTAMSKGVPTRFTQRTVSLSDLYNGQYEDVNTSRRKEFSGGMVLDFIEKWDPPAVYIELKWVSKNQDNILFRTSQGSRVDAAIDQLINACNWNMPRLEANYTPLSLQPAAIIAPKPTPAPQKQLEALGSTSPVTPPRISNSSGTLPQLPNAIGEILTVDTDFGFVTARASGLQIGDTIRSQSSSGQVVLLTVAKKSDNGTYSLIPENGQTINSLKPGYRIAK